MTNASDRPGTSIPSMPDPGAFGATEEFFSSRPTREPAPETGFRFDASSLGGADVRVVEAHVREGLGELYEAVVDVCTAESPDFGSLLGTRATLEIARGPRTRRVCGVVRRVERLDSWGGLRRARVTMVPALWALSQRVDSRIFQDVHTLDIVQSVLSEAGLDAPTLETRRDYPKREYCVQYRESDLAFVLRLLEEEGVVLYFRHDGDAETVVLTDAASYGLCPTLDRRPVPFSPPQSEQAPVEVVQRLDFARELRSTGFTGRDYDFTRPLATLDMTRAQPRGEQGERPRYEFPARFTPGPYDEGSRTYGAHDGGHRVEVRQGEEQCAEDTAAGGGNVTGFMPGRVFQLLGHEHADLDQRYLLTHVEHHLHAPEELLTDPDARASHTAAGIDRYRNTFRCVPARGVYVLPRKTPRPMVLAAQTAVVTGDGDEEIHVDAHGRVKVQFHWDRKGKHDGHSSCWVRVSQNQAGAAWGFMFIPRVGMEVVVTFLEGDPDRPLITGCVYNGVNRPPYELPDKRTVSTIKTVSSPGGHGFNELRFEDLAGSEEIFLHAQRDLNEIVNHDHTLTVWNDQHITIKGHQYVTVNGEGPKPAGMPGPGHGVKVNGEYSIDASGDVHIQSGGSIHEEATSDRFMKARSIYLKGDDVVQVNAPRFNVIATDKIILRVGGSAISISDGGILIKSSGSVKIDAPVLKMRGSGGASLTSSGIMDISGTPLQLNGPGPFAGRVTELAPATITTGAALTLIGGASFPYPVEKQGDGSLKVGKHIVIKKGTGLYGDFQGKVLRDLGILSSTPNGQERLKNIENNPNGHDTVIREYNADDAKEHGTWNNSSAARKGNPDNGLIKHDADGNPVPNSGCPTEIAYNPDIVDGPAGSPAPADATLFHEMGHAEHNAYGVNQREEKMGGGWDNREEWQNIDGGVNNSSGNNNVPGSPHSPSENDYLGDRNYPYRRADHGEKYVRPDGSPI